MKTYDECLLPSAWFVLVYPVFLGGAWERDFYRLPPIYTLPTFHVFFSVDTKMYIWICFDLVWFVENALSVESLGNVIRRDKKYFEWYLLRESLARFQLVSLCCFNVCIVLLFNNDIHIIQHHNSVSAFMMP